MNILVLDIGTTSMRGVLFDPKGQIKDVVSVSTPLLIDKRENHIEQDPHVYLESTAKICRALSEKYAIDAVSVTAFRSAPTMVERDGRALTNFIMWQDTRNSGICARLHDANAEIYRRCGASVNTVFTGTKLTWLRENRPNVYDGAYKAMIVPDYVIHFMTGEFVTDRTYGSRTLLMDIRSLEWDAEMCRMLNVDMEKLCPLCDQGSVAGHVNAAFAEISGLRAGIPVISAGGDQQCGALGLGIMDSSTIEVNSGTGSFVISLMEEPCLDNPNVICNVAAIPGKYTQEMNIIASAASLNWLIREIFPEYWDEKPNFAAINRIAAQTPPGANGLISVPHFQGCGSRSWNPEARAGFWGFSLGTRREDLIRALYEGIACEISKSIDVLPEVCRRANTIAVAGGMSGSDVYNQILCDFTGRRLTRSENIQATAVGAYVSAAVCSGLYSDYADALAAARSGDTRKVFKPNAENIRLYRSIQSRSESLYRTASREGER